MTPGLIAIGVYLALQLGIGVWIARRIRSETDYLLAGRSLGYTFATFSIFATWFGSETVVGSAGNAFRDGVSLASAEPFGYGLCLILMGVVFAAPLWRRRLTTLADLFRQRYSVPVERVAAVILIPGSILWAAAQIRSFGYVVSAAAPKIPIDVAIGAAAAFTLLYTVFGGLLADVIHDLIQGITISIGLIVVLAGVLLRLHETGGIGPVLADVGPIALLPAGGGVGFWDIAEEWAIPVCGSVIATELVGRIIATRTPNVAQRSSIMAGMLYMMIGTIPLLIGLLGQHIVPNLGEAEQVIPAVAQALLPTLFFAIFAGALVSAILSTVDSTLLVSSGLMSHNLVVPIFKVTDERTKVRIARAGVLAFGALAYVQAIRAEGVFELVEDASAFGSAGTLVTVCFGLFTSLGGPMAAMLTLLGGMASYLIATAAGFAYPFLLSLGLSVLTYVTTAVVERVTARVQHA